MVLGGTKLPETCIRSACAMWNVKPFKCTITNSNIAMDHRRGLLRSLGLSVLTLHAGTWFGLTHSEYDAWQSALFKLCQSVHSRDAQWHVIYLDMYEMAMQVIACRHPLGLEPSGMGKLIILISTLVYDVDVCCLILPYSTVFCRVQAQVLLFLFAKV